MEEPKQSVPTAAPSRDGSAAEKQKKPRSEEGSFRERATHTSPPVVSPAGGGEGGLVEGSSVNQPASPRRGPSGDRDESEERGASDSSPQPSVGPSTTRKRKAAASDDETMVRLLKKMEEQIEQMKQLQERTHESMERDLKQRELWVQARDRDRALWVQVRERDRELRAQEWAMRQQEDDRRFRLVFDVMNQSLGGLSAPRPLQTRDPARADVAPLLLENRPSGSSSIVPGNPPSSSGGQQQQSLQNPSAGQGQSE